MHRTFARLIARHRELLQAVEEKRRLLIEIESLADRLNLSEPEAYRKAIWRRGHPREAEAEDRRLDEEERKTAEERFGPDDDDGALGEDDTFDDEFAGTKDEWDIFADLFEAMTGERPPPRGAFRKAQPKPRVENKPAKELYRAIVRRLHPDHHGHMDEARKNLWHEAQEAYRRRDVNALHSILARCDGGAAGLGDHSPVSLIRRLTQQLRKAARSARGEMRRVKQDLAWNYEQRARQPQFIRRIKDELEQGIAAADMELIALTRAISDLERRANRPPQSQRAHRRERRDTRSAFLQDEFPL
jgi:hypothetical protein